ncbi:lipopolysaccharide biosynthesis protein [Aestuariibaculum sp. YM273]|uniref:lipopolysaccharide biosynthesis protein n=1 Tax=Aestuariibaculum sp. YM273 TaxID=3070659 RepID=UPI0027DC2B34|nr:lipopolysaccharide biosynthesis protein [Aestuariibaculum sp. YM273]WMI66634.1 lipopolysaccharide biosynthesis protein [Aestuariibaculum sp. YM273]
MDSKKIVSGIKWTGIEFVLNTSFRFIVQFVLVKLLLPEEFGLVGMCTVFLAVTGAASELGMSAALIQRKDDSEVEKMYSTAYWSGIGFGVLFFLFMCFAVAPFATYFYGEPILIKLIAFLSLGVLIKPFSLIYNVILTRALNFKKIAQIFNLSAFIAGVIAVFAAYNGVGVWALVINNILSIALTLPMLYFSTKWKPKLEWNKEYFKSIFGFGIYSTGTGVFSTLTYNIDNLIIGKMLGASVLGSYTLSFSLTEQLRQTVSAVLNKVMYPVFGKSQDDKQKLKSYFLKIINFNALLIFPLMTYFFLFAEEIIGFFGEKWIDAIVPLKILSIAMMIHLLINSFTSLIRGLGKPKLEMKIIVGLTLFVLVPGLYFGISFFGLVGASFAILINKFFLVVIGIIVLKKEIGLKIVNVFCSVRSALIGVFMSSFVVLILKLFFDFESILILSFIYVISYLSSIYCLESKTITPLIKKLF